jgi:hypothetical protein
VAADTDLVMLRLRIALRTCHVLTAPEAAHPPTVALAMTSFIVTPAV